MLRPVKVGPSKQGNSYVYDDKPIGSGAFAKVFKGKLDIVNEVVAIKRIVKDDKFKKDPQLMKFITDEIQLQLELRNKYIVDVLDYLEDERFIYIVQEYCDGGTLDSVLKERRVMEEDEAIMIFNDLLVGCRELSQKNIAHRDLKPDNILIANGIYKLADFGFADKIEKSTFSNVGTPLYMSPQQLNNQKTTKSDIWSLGVIFYQMLQGYQTTPWGHLNTFRSTEQLKTKIMTQTSLYFDPRYPVSQVAKDFIYHCLQRDEQRRISWDQMFNHPLFNKKDVGNGQQQQQQQQQQQPQIRQQQSQIPPNIQGYSQQPQIPQSYIQQGYSYQQPQPPQGYRPQQPIQYVQQPPPPPMGQVYVVQNQQYAPPPRNNYNGGGVGGQQPPPPPQAQVPLYNFDNDRIEQPKGDVRGKHPSYNVGSKEFICGFCDFPCADKVEFDYHVKKCMDELARQQ